jgi:hypothetical protein
MGSLPAAPGVVLGRADRAAARAGNAGQRPGCLQADDAA